MKFILSTFNPLLPALLKQNHLLAVSEFNNWHLLRPSQWLLAPVSVFSFLSKWNVAAKSKIGRKCGIELVLWELETLEDVANCVRGHRVFPILKSINQILNIDGVWFHTFYGSQSVKENWWKSFSVLFNASGDLML